MTSNHLQETPCKRWLTTTDYKNEYGVSKSTQYRQRKEGLLPFTQSKTNGAILYDRFKIDALLEQNSTDIES
jgi:hypothetical protein